MGRKTGIRSPGFITTVLNLINTFYDDVVQDITPWQPPAPKRAKQESADEDDEDDETTEPATDDSYQWWAGEALGHTWATRGPQKV